MSYQVILNSNFSEYSVDLEYEFSLVQRKIDGRERSFTTIPLIEPQSARHFGIKPGQSNPKLEFKLYNNGEDKSNGSLLASNITDSRFSGGTVTTVQEQIIWLTEYIADNSSDPRWLLFGGRFSDRNGDGVDEGTQAVIKNIRHRRIAGQTAARAEINFKLGVTV